MRKIGVALIVCPLLAAICGLAVMWQIASQDYDALDLEYSSILVDWADEVKKNEVLAESNDNLMLDNAMVEQELVALQATHNTLTIQYNELEIDRDMLVVGRDALETKKVELVAYKNTLLTELAGIKRVFPPRHFYGYSELEGWVLVHCNFLQGSNLYLEHLKYQELALADGYIWSVYYQVVDEDTTRVGSVAIAGDDVYWVWNDGYIEWKGWKY